MGDISEGVADTLYPAKKIYKKKKRKECQQQEARIQLYNSRDFRTIRDASTRPQKHQGRQQETPETAGTPARDAKNSRDARKTGDAFGSRMLATARTHM
jgi:hypothetical protein